MNETQIAIMGLVAVIVVGIIAYYLYQEKIQHGTLNLFPQNLKPPC